MYLRKPQFVEKGYKMHLHQYNELSRHCCDRDIPFHKFINETVTL